MKRRPKDDIAQQLQNAQLTIVEKALIGFVEESLGRVPSDKEILAKSFHMAFAPTDLSVYETEGRRFCQYWCYGGTDVIALGFLDTNDLLCLYTARVPKDNLPWAVKAHIEQWRAKNNSSQ